MAAKAVVLLEELLTIFSKYEIIDNKKQSVSTLDEYVKGCFDDDFEFQLNCIKNIRILSSIPTDKKQMLQSIIDTNIVAHLLQILSTTSNKSIQNEIIWLLLNIASGTHQQTSYIVDNGVLVIFNKLLSDLDILNNDTIELILWAIANICGSDPKYRDIVLASIKILDVLLILLPKISMESCQTAAWLLSNLCRDEPKTVQTRFVPKQLQCINMLIQKKDENIIQHTCIALKYLTNHQSMVEVVSNTTAFTNCGRKRRMLLIDAYLNSESKIIIPCDVRDLCFNYINYVCIDLEEIKVLINLLDHKSHIIRYHVLDVIGNFVQRKDDQQVDSIIHCGLLHKFEDLFEKEGKKRILQSSCWIISNITAGTVEQIESVMRTTIFKRIIGVANADSHSLEVVKEALWVICNALTRGTDEQIVSLIDMGVIPVLCAFLRRYRRKLTIIALEGLDRILEVGWKQMRFGYNEYAMQVETCHGIDYLEGLQADDNVPQQIYDKAASIIIKHFHDTMMHFEDDADDD